MRAALVLKQRYCSMSDYKSKTVVHAIAVIVDVILNRS